MLAQLHGLKEKKAVLSRSHFRLAENCLYQKDIEVAEYEDGVWWSEGHRYTSLAIHQPVVLQFEGHEGQAEIVCDTVRITDGAMWSGLDGEQLVARYSEADRAWRLAERDLLSDTVSILPHKRALSEVA